MPNTIPIELEDFIWLLQYAPALSACEDQQRLLKLCAHAYAYQNDKALIDIHKQPQVHVTMPTMILPKAGSGMGKAIDALAQQYGAKPKNKGKSFHLGSMITTQVTMAEGTVFFDVIDELPDGGIEEVSAMSLKNTLLNPEKPLVGFMQFFLVTHHKVEAIKEIRALTKFGLETAKKLVEGTEILRVSGDTAAVQSFMSTSLGWCGANRWITTAEEEQPEQPLVFEVAKCLPPLAQKLTQENFDCMQQPFVGWVRPIAPNDAVLLVKAIKELRSCANLTLKEAKDVIEGNSLLRVTGHPSKVKEFMCRVFDNFGVEHWIEADGA